MPQYPRLFGVLQRLQSPLTDFAVTSQIAPYLTAVWLEDYGRLAPSYDVVETKDGGFSYLFDIQAERLIAAWGLSKGKGSSSRSIIASRMKGHPLTVIVSGKRYHRGHAIPHTMGGRTDINLVPQLGTFNSGRFQEFERKAVATPGSLYFTYWSYSDPRTQRPSAVQQGFLVGGSPPSIVQFQN